MAAAAEGPAQALRGGMEDGSGGSEGSEDEYDLPWIQRVGAQEWARLLEASAAAEAVRAAALDAGGVGAAPGAGEANWWARARAAREAARAAGLGPAVAAVRRGEGGVRAAGGVAVVEEG